VPAEYAADFLDMVLVREVMSGNVRTLKAGDTLGAVRQWIEAGGPGTSHQGFPILDEGGVLVGVLTRRNLLDSKTTDEKTIREVIGRPPSYVYDDLTLRDAADHMVRHDVGRLPVVSRQTRRVVGIVTRSDLLRAHRRRLVERDGEVAWSRGGKSNGVSRAPAATKV
jgi:CBS domain-containing protein